VVNFVAEGGQVQPSCATVVVNGISQCSVNFISQNPRPSGGRVSVLAYLAGTKDYTDNDQNNKFDTGDTLQNIGDAFRDDNENGELDLGEFVVRRGGTLVCDGVGAPFPSVKDSCDLSLSTTVRQQAIILFASSSPNFSLQSASNSSVQFDLSSAHNTLLPMPVGTVITADTVDSTNNSLNCSVQRVFGTPIPNISPTFNKNANLATSHSVTLKDCSEGDGVNISIQTPSGLTTTRFVEIPKSSTPPVTSPVPDSIVSDEPVPSQIFVKGNGLEERASISFRVRAGSASAGAGHKVKIGIINNIGGIGIGERGSTEKTLTTDANGVVTVSIFSGTLPTPVKVRAELLDENSKTNGIFVETQNLSIASGPPSQRFMSVSATKFVLNGSIDGDRTEITARVADRQGNAVPDGTVINFITEGGQVGSSCTTKTTDRISSCSVTFETQRPRPNDGRVSVLVYAEGTKDYSDKNNNNELDAGELINIGNAFRDDNEDGVVSEDEIVIARNATGGTCTAGKLPFPAQVDTCDTTLKTTVRQQIVLLFAKDQAEFNDIVPSPTDISFRVNSLGILLVPMQEGTTISAQSLNDVCTVREVFPASVPRIFPNLSNPSAQLGSRHNVSLSCTSGVAQLQGRIRLLATAPNGVVSSTTVDVIVPATPITSP